MTHPPDPPAVALYRGALGLAETFGALDFDGLVTPWEAVPEGGKAAALALLDAQLVGRPSADWFEIPGGPLPAASASNANRAPA